MKPKYRIVEITKENKSTQYRIEKLKHFLFIPIKWDIFTITDKGLPYTYTSQNLAQKEIDKLISLYHGDKAETEVVVYKS